MRREIAAFHGQVFSGLGPEFRVASWTKVVISAGRDMLPEQYAALARAAQERGDDAYAVVDVETEPPFQVSAFLPWDLEKHYDAWTQTSLVGLDAHMFGRSGSWGVHCAYDGYSILGGEQDVMDRVLADIGTPDYLWEQFLGGVDPYVDAAAVGRALHPGFELDT